MSDDAFGQTRRNARVIGEVRRKIIEYAIASDSLILSLANALDAEHDAEIHGNIERCGVCELLARAREWAR